MRRTGMRLRVFLMVCAFGLASGSALAESRFSAMEQAIGSGTFQKIGSVAVEQDGRVVYEHYFEGDATTLRDTRSATKTITSLLTGIAIGEGR